MNTIIFWLLAGATFAGVSLVLLLSLRVMAALLPDRRAPAQEETAHWRAAEDLTAYLPGTRAVGLLGTDPRTWGPTQYALIRAAFDQQYPLAWRGLQNATVAVSSDAEIVFRCHRTGFPEIAWHWRVDRATGTFVLDRGAQ